MPERIGKQQNDARRVKQWSVHESQVMTVKPVLPSDEIAVKNVHTLRTLAAIRRMAAKTSVENSTQCAGTPRQEEKWINVNSFVQLMLKEAAKDVANILADTVEKNCTFLNINIKD